MGSTSQLMIEVWPWIGRELCLVRVKIIVEGLFEMKVNITKVIVYQSGILCLSMYVFGMQVYQME